jgi:hypothetical protein
MNKDMDVVYFLTPQPYIVDCLLADFERRRYRRTFLYWTSSKLPRASIPPAHKTDSRLQYYLLNYANV